MVSKVYFKVGNYSLFPVYGVAKTHTIPVTMLPFGQTPRCFTNPWGTRGKP